MRIITRDFTLKKKQRGKIEIVPLGDIHIGAAACDEEKLKEAVRYIRDRDDCYWIGMGDYCDFINVSDMRFDPENLAEWIKVADLTNIVGRQVERFCQIIRPIASKCLCLVEGNHEKKITKAYERPVFYEIVHKVRQLGGFPEDYKLAIGYTGWLRLRFSYTRGQGTRVVVVNLHHGAGGGTMVGGKANRLERRLWNHDADLIIFGHCHNTTAHVVEVCGLDRNGRFVTRKRKGVYAGTFLRTHNVKGPDTYAEIKQYPPTPTGFVRIIITPFVNEAVSDIVHIVT